MTIKPPTNGWLSPRGKMLAGEPGCHTRIAYEVLGGEVDGNREMDEAGWWKLTSHGQAVDSIWVGSKPATNRQKRYILQWYKDWSRFYEEDEMWSPWLHPTRLPDFRGLDAQAKAAANAAGE